MSDLRKTLLLTGGILCVILGLIGMLLPVLPTTPFLLLAAYLFARSSPRWLDWLLTNRWLGAYIRNYREGRGMLFWHKLITITLLWLTIGATIWLGVSSTWLRLLLAAIATGVTIHLLRVKTYRPSHGESASLPPEMAE